PGSDYYKNPDKYGIEFMKEAPHKILKNRTFPQDEYDNAKLLSYFVYLIHHFDEMRNGIYELRTKKNGLRLVDYYCKFEAFVNGNVDYLLGRDIQNVTSWFFEAIAQEFLSDARRVELLQNKYDQFMKEEAWG
ncbi:MAG: hypothetical protein ACXABY_16265, partial [Candidatus Thorarchaeota archaeon]